MTMTTSILRSVCPQVTVSEAEKNRLERHRKKTLGVALSSARWALQAGRLAHWLPAESQIRLCLTHLMIRHLSSILRPTLLSPSRNPQTIIVPCLKITNRIRALRLRLARQETSCRRMIAQRLPTYSPKPLLKKRRLSPKF